MTPSSPPPPASAGVCNVFAAQNLPLLHAAFERGSPGQGKRLTLALLGNLSCKVFHAQTDQETNVYAADLCGKVKRRYGNWSLSHAVRGL